MINQFRKSGGFLPYLTAAGGVAAVVAVLAPFNDDINSTVIALALLLVVLITATVFGSRPALFASLLGTLSFNFFFLPPFYTLTISDSQNWIAFGAFVATALIAGQLSSYARRRAEESETRQKEIERLYVELQNAFEKASETEALRRSEKFKSALLDAVTHDLRTPLTSIKASATTLLEDFNEKSSEETLQLDDEARREFLEIINEESDRLNKFIGGMVNLAKVQAGELHLQKRWSEIKEIINDAIERAKIRLDSYHILIELERDLPVVLIDAASITEVLYTLLDNAAKYSPDASKIRISVRRRAGQKIEIAVEDMGRGIPVEMREKIFDKFFRADGNAEHTASSGLGLGLAIARGIVESQDGTIWVEDGSDGFVTRFAFQIPVGDD